MEEEAQGADSVLIKQAKRAKEEALRMPHEEAPSTDVRAPVQAPAPTPPSTVAPTQVATAPQPLVQAAPAPVSTEVQMYSVLTVGSELALLSSDSPVRKRIFSYGRRFKSMQIVLLSGKTGQGIVQEGNVTVYPTNSSNKIFRYFDATK